jgi:hypothetical protein
LTPSEQRLARRIHKQRVRLRQLEVFSWQPYDRWRRWMDLALRLGKENRDMKAGTLTAPPMTVDRAVEVIDGVVRDVLSEYEEELTMQQIKVAADQIARIAMAKLTNGQ